MFKENIGDIPAKLFGNIVYQYIQIVGFLQNEVKDYFDT